MSKPENADAIIAKYPALQRLINGKNALASRLVARGYDKSELVNLENYTSIIGDLGFDIDSILESNNLNVADYVRAMIEYTIQELETLGENPTYTTEQYAYSNLLEAPAGYVKGNVYRTFYASQLNTAGKITLLGNSNIAGMFANCSSLSGVVTIDCNGYTCQTTDNTYSAMTENTQVEGIEFLNGNIHVRCEGVAQRKKLQFVHGLPIGGAASNKWMSFYSNWFPSGCDVTYSGQATSLYSGLTSSGTLAYGGRNAWILPTNAPVSTFFDLIDHLYNYGELTPRLGSAYSGNNYAVNAICLNKTGHKPILEDAGRYSEFIDKLHERGWYEQTEDSTVVFKED